MDRASANRPISIVRTLAAAIGLLAGQASQPLVAAHAQTADSSAAGARAKASRSRGAKPSRALRSFRSKLRSEYQSDIARYSPRGAEPSPVDYEKALQNRAHVGRILRDVSRFRRSLRERGVDLAALRTGIVTSDVGKSRRAMKEIIERAIREKLPKKDGAPWKDSDYFAAFLNHERYALDALKEAGLSPEESKLVRGAIVGHNGPGTPESWWGKSWEKIMGGQYATIETKEGFVHAVADRVDGAIVEPGVGTGRDARGFAVAKRGLVGGLVKIVDEQWAALQSTPPEKAPPGAPKSFAEIVRSVVGATDTVLGQLDEIARLAIAKGRETGDAGLVRIFEETDGYYAWQRSRLLEMKKLMGGPDPIVTIEDAEVRVLGKATKDPAKFFEALHAALIARENGLGIPVGKPGILMPDAVLEVIDHEKWTPLSERVSEALARSGGSDALWIEFMRTPESSNEGKKIFEEGRVYVEIPKRRAGIRDEMAPEARAQALRDWLRKPGKSLAIRKFSRPGEDLGISAPRPHANAVEASRRIKAAARAAFPKDSPEADAASRAALLIDSRVFDQSQIPWEKLSHEQLARVSDRLLKESKEFDFRAGDFEEWVRATVEDELKR